MKKLYILIITIFTINIANAQWTALTSGTTNNLNSVFFTDANTGYAVGDYGTILKTTNGGGMGMAQKIEEEDFKFYPNPTQDILHIDLLSIKDFQDSKIIIYDIQGQLLLQQTIKQSQIEINISSFAKGVYIIKVYNDNNIMVSKFIKE